MFDRFCFTVSVAALVNLDTVSFTPLKIFDAACPIPEFRNLFFTSSIFCFALSNAPSMVSLIFPNPSFTAVHNLFTAFLNVSDLLYKSTNPATSAVTAITTNAIGFIDITVFNAVCAAVIAPVAAVPATLATL